MPRTKRTESRREKIIIRFLVVAEDQDGMSQEQRFALYNERIFKAMAADGREALGDIDVNVVHSDYGDSLVRATFEA